MKCSTAGNTLRHKTELLDPDVIRVGTRCCRLRARGFLIGVTMKVAFPLVVRRAWKPASGYALALDGVNDYSEERNSAPRICPCNRAKNLDPPLVCPTMPAVGKSVQKSVGPLV